MSQSRRRTRSQIVEEPEEESHHRSQRPRTFAASNAVNIITSDSEDEVDNHPPPRTVDEPFGLSTRNFAYQVPQASFGKPGSTLDPEVVKRQGKKLARLAICAENRRVPLKREEMIKLVCPEEGYQLRTYLAEAQKHLRRVFGMELVEYPHKEQRHSSTRARPALRPPQPTKTYTLRSILPPVVLEDIAPVIPRDSDMLGLGMTLLSLIYVNGLSMTDASLRKYLRILGAPLTEDDGIILGLMSHPSSSTTSSSQRRTTLGYSQSLARRVDADKSSPIGMIRRLVQQGYLERCTVDGTRTDPSVPEQYLWKWGPRAKVEISEKTILHFIEKMFGEDSTTELLMAAQKASRLDEATGETEQ